VDRLEQDPIRVGLLLAASGDGNECVDHCSLPPRDVFYRQPQRVAFTWK
jgi:hypothetical protein